ncbi:BTB/POZ domain-containing adapter for CUL3-mediated RhoA degradation protein 3-like, partial [Gracilinanus agilis]|uniref:BTB/POZ domain-containing adapter for CUL3-mediated RhoA degradation protein 3-like n=1 Tax=Gracilinanus agilis TaxID=191870 RepID=UPI001CFF165C
MGARQGGGRFRAGQEGVCPRPGALASYLGDPRDGGVPEPQTERAGAAGVTGARAAASDRGGPVSCWILIDRCGKHFGTILNYLRDGAVPLPESRREVEELLAEAKYYLVQGLVDECQAALQNKDSYEPFCKVPVITSSKEEQKLIATSNKPAVKLLYNRSNNKYSYT